MDRGWILSRRSYASPSSWNRPTSWRAEARPSHPSCDSPLIFRARAEGSIVCVECLPVPFELLKGDAFPRPRIRVPVVLLDRLFVPKQGHPGVAAFEGELGELQQDLRLLFVGFDRLDEGLEISVGRRRRRGRLRFLFNFFEGLQQGMEVPRGLRLRFLLRLARRLFRDLTDRSRFRLDGRRHAY